jgi:hypothetical protein
MRQVERMEAEPPEVGVCFCGARILRNAGADKPTAYVPDRKWERATFKKFVMGRVQFLTPTVVVRRACLEETGLMVPEMRRNQDGEFLLRLFARFRLAVIPECYAVIHIVTGSRRTSLYDSMNAALPYRLRHSEMIRQRLGLWAAVRYRCMHRRNLLCAAVRERRWREAGRDALRRCREFPLPLPNDVKTLVKAAIIGLTQRNGETTP